MGKRENMCVCVCVTGCFNQISEIITFHSISVLVLRRSFLQLRKIYLNLNNSVSSLIRSLQSFGIKHLSAFERFVLFIIVCIILLYISIFALLYYC